MTRRLYTLNSTLTYYTGVGPVEERIGLILSLMDVSQSSFFACLVHFSMSRNLPINGVEMSYACFLACASFFLFVPSPQATAFLAFITTPTHLSCCFLFLWRLGRPKLHNSFLMAFALFLFLLCRLQRATCSFLCLPSSRCSPCFSGDSKSQLYSILCLCSSSHSVFFSATPLQLPIFCVYQHHALFSSSPLAVSPVVVASVLLILSLYAPPAPLPHISKLHGKLKNGESKSRNGKQPTERQVP